MLCVQKSWRDCVTHPLRVRVMSLCCYHVRVKGRGSAVAGVYKQPRGRLGKPRRQALSARWCAPRMDDPRSDSSHSAEAAVDGVVLGWAWWATRWAQWAPACCQHEHEHQHERTSETVLRSADAGVPHAKQSAGGPIVMRTAWELSTHCVLRQRMLDTSRKWHIRLSCNRAPLAVCLT